jgi:hypothetical protein
MYIEISPACCQLCNRQASKPFLGLRNKKKFLKGLASYLPLQARKSAIV